MINYLEKFNNLPDVIKQAISSEEAMAAIAEIENAYDVSLATVIMRVVVKDISILDLSKFFVFEHEMDAKRAEDLVKELKAKVFYLIADYLGFESDKRAPSALEMKIKSEIGGDIKKAASSSFFFSSEDEEEVSELAKKVNSFVDKDELTRQKEELTKQMDMKLNMILNQITVKFSSMEMTNRFRYVISAYLRGIRNRIDTRQVLKKDIPSGGLEFDDILVDRILSIVDKVNTEEIKKDDIKKPAGRISVPEDAIANRSDNKKEAYNELKLAGVRDMDYDFSKFTAAKNVETEKLKVEVEEAGTEAELEKKKSEKPKEKNDEIVIDLSVREKLDSIINEVSQEYMAKKPETTVPIKTPELQMEKAGIEEKKSIEPNLQSDNINIVNIRQPAEDSGRRRMEDVKYVPKLTGPIEELGEMTLVDFRRLSHDPSVSARKISEKISILEEENYGQRLAGIKAWRQSPVNKLYLEIGRQSISNKMGVEEVINNLRNAGSDFLTSDEFSSIMDLNKDLRF
jgi:hypothetical protein